MIVAALLLLVLPVFLAGCSSGISRQEAESKALSIIRDNVFFYANNGQQTIGFDEYTVKTLTSYQEGRDWVVSAHITADLNGTEKSKDLVIKMDSSGKLIEFDGQKVR